MPIVQRPHHTGIRVRDPDRSRHLDRDLLGFELVSSWNHRAERIRTLTGCPDADVHAAVLRKPEARSFGEHDAPAEDA